MKKRNLFKQSVSVMLALLIVLSSLVIVPMAGAEGTDDELPPAWDGMSLDYSWYKVADAGTADKPYEIANGAQLAAWSALSNGTYTPADIGETGDATLKFFNDKYFVLTADINMGGNHMNPILAGFHDTNGIWHDEYGSGLHFDGQDHVIYNLMVNKQAIAHTITPAQGEPIAMFNTVANEQTAAMFTTLGPNSVIENLHFVGAEINNKDLSGSWRSTAVLVGHATTQNVRISNITIDETSKILGYRICAGIVAYVLDRETSDTYGTLTVENCFSAAYVTCTGRSFGGMVGNCIANGTLNIEDCIFAGVLDILSNSTGGVTIGGMVAGAGDCPLNMNIKNCANIGTYQTFEDAAHTKAYSVYGITAGCSKAGATVALENCYVMTEQSYKTTGAVTTSAFSFNGTTKSVKNCYAYGEYADAENLVNSPLAAIETAPFTYSTMIEEIYAILGEVAGMDIMGELEDMYLEAIAWDGLTYDYSWYKAANAGTAENPYKIDSAAAMAAWSALSTGTYTPADIGETGEAAKKVFNDKYFVLTNDINFAGNSILPIVAGVMESQKWVNANGSGLHFDGQGYTIYNLAITAPAPGSDGQALFSHIGPNSTVKNLNFVGAKIGKGVGGWAPAAVLAAYAPTDGINVENIFIDETTVVDGNHIVGGIFAYMMDRATDKAAPTANVKNCVVKATLKATGVRSAGILGCHIVDKGVVNFENCVFAGNFEVEKAANTTVALAGIAGITMDVASTMTFKNCVNAGNFYTPDGVKSSKAVVIAGISNPKEASATTTQSFENCYDLSTRAVESDVSVTNIAIVNGATVVEAMRYSYAVAQDGVTYTDTENVVATADTEITLENDTTKSTVATQVAEISKKLMTVSLGIGTGAEQAEPVVIDSAEDLYLYAINSELFGNGEQVWIELKADVDMADYPIEAIKVNTAVYFDGNGHTIKNLNVYSETAGGLFQELPAGSIVENVNFASAYIDAAADAGVVVGVAYAPFTMDKVTTDSNSYVISGDNAGGLVGAIEEKGVSGIGETIVITNCINAADVYTTYSRAGGIVGRTSTDAEVRVGSCVNYGDLTVENAGTSNSMAGGIIAHVNSITGTNDTVVYFESCVNYGNIRVSTSNTYNFVGGILGWAQTKNDATNNPVGMKLVVDHCFDLGGQKVGVSTNASPKPFNPAVTVGNSGDAELDKEIKDSWGIAGVTGLKLHSCGTTNNPVVESNNGIAADANAEITLSGGKSTIATEVANILVETHPECVYEADCDASCNICGKTRTNVAQHAYDNACDVDCNACGEIRKVGDHVSSGACDEYCNECGAPLDATADHTFDHGCDADCNVCGEIREVEGHAYDGACDEACNNCNTPNADATAHTWDNDCDTECNVCHKTRTTEHRYTADCDATCDSCNEARENVADHTFDGPCDADCNGCGVRRRAGEHTYDDEYDADCNVCGETREVPQRPAPETPEDTTKAPDNTTKAPDTEAPAEDPGCGGSIAGVGALLALTATFGFAFVGKKKED